MKSADDKKVLKIEGTLRWKGEEIGDPKSITYVPPQYWIFDHNTLREENEGYWSLEDIHGALYHYERPDEIHIVLRRETDPPADREF